MPGVPATQCWGVDRLIGKHRLELPGGLPTLSQLPGSFFALAVNWALGWAAGSFAVAASYSFPFQSISIPAAGYPIPSHQISLSSVSATLVKMVSLSTLIFCIETDISVNMNHRRVPDLWFIII
jgi:hypothetical protein